MQISKFPSSKAVKDSAKEIGVFLCSGDLYELEKTPSKSKITNSCENGTPYYTSILGLHSYTPYFCAL